MIKQGPSYEVTNLEEQHIEQILQLQQKVIHALPDKKVLQPLAKEEFLNILRGNGKMVGAWVKEQLIAFRALLVPPENDPEHLGLDAGVTDLSTVIYQEISNVDPMYRGNKLQQKLAQILMEQLKKESHQYRYVCCTVAPFNYPSLKDKFAQDMQIIDLKEKYGGSLRYVFMKDLQAAKVVQQGEVIEIKMDDITKQQQYLQSGWRGVKMTIAEQETKVVYARFNEVDFINEIV